MDDIIYYNELYDLYGELLTNKQKQYFEDYYFNNMSFAEMADLYNISRNAAFKQIHIVIQKLDEYEKILHLREKKNKIFKVLEDAPLSIKEKIELII